MTIQTLFHGADNHIESTPYHYRECGLDNIYLMNGFSLENCDGDEYVSIRNIEELWKAIGLNLITSQKDLSPKEIRFLRRQMRYTQSELANRLRVTDQTVARWEKDTCKMPGPADLVLRVLFLSSEIAQPQGKEILSTWLDLVMDLVEQDAPTKGEILFMCGGKGWERDPLPVAC